MPYLEGYTSTTLTQRRKHTVQSRNATRLFPVQTEAQMIFVVCFPSAIFRCSKWQIIQKSTFGRLVAHPERFSRRNVWIESGTVGFFQWSISWATEQWSVKRKSHTGCLFSLIIARAEHFEESKSPYVAPLMTSICPAVLGRLSAFLLVCDRSLIWPTVSSAHLRQHQDDCVQTTRSQLDAEGGEGAFDLLLPVQFGSCFSFAASAWQVHAQTKQRNMTGSLLQHTAQSPSRVCSL